MNFVPYAPFLIRTASAMALHDFATNYPAVRVGANPSLGAIVVDSGYSFTHIVPFFDRTRLNYAIKRHAPS